MSKIENNVLYSKEVREDGGYEGRFMFRLLDLVQRELGETGDRDWLIDISTEQSIRISHILGRSTVVASGLTKLGLGPGQTLMAAIPTCLEFYWPVFGTWLCGSVVSVSDPWLPEDLIKVQIQDLKPTIIVTQRAFAQKFVAANKLVSDAERAKHILILDLEAWEKEVPQGTTSFRKLYNDDGLSCPKRSSALPYNPKEEMVIHWTSGTSGKPKGVVHSNGYLNLMLRKSELPQGTVSLNSNIFFHSGAFLLPLDGGIYNRFTCCFIKEEIYTPEVCLDAIAKYKPMFYMCGTNHFFQVANTPVGERDVSSLRIVMPAGGKLSSAVVERMSQQFPSLAAIYQFYGNTEVSGISGTMQHGTLGGLRAGVEVYIRDTATGKRKEPGEEGEIMAKTPTMMLRYLNRPEDTANFTDEEGFAFMGDLGHYDDAGKLYYKERIKEMIKVDNFWIGPGEIEDTLEMHPAVREAVVWAVPNQQTGVDIIHAGVVLSGAGTVDGQDILDSVNSRLLNHKRITGIHVMDAIPCNPQGKKLRREVKEMFKK